MNKINILLGSKKSKLSSNEVNNININLTSNQRVLPVNNLEETIDRYDEYLQDKECCTKYNLAFTVNTVCSNVLSNIITEIVYKEGSDECTTIDYTGTTSANKKINVKEINRVSDYLKYKGYTGGNLTSYKLTRDEMIKDTSYSHSDIGPFVYHCGYDIFNNHILRSNSFSMINPLSSGSTFEQKKYFNTINDYNRLHTGEIVQEDVGGIKLRSNGTPILSVTNSKLNKEKYNLHEYEYSMIDSFNKTISEKMVENDGWFGFINPTTIEIENCILPTSQTNEEKTISINRCMNNNKVCEQIDFYPDRSLYTMTPKYNKYKHRLENNWDVFLTYPYKNYYDSDLVEVDVNDDKINGLSCEIVSNMTDIFETEYEIFRDYTGNPLGSRIVIYPDDVSVIRMPSPDGSGNIITGYTTHDKSELKTNSTIIFRSSVSHNLEAGDLIRMTIIKYEDLTDDDGNVIGYTPTGYTEIERDISIVSVGYDNSYFDNYFTINSSELYGYLDSADLLTYLSKENLFDIKYYFDCKHIRFRFSKVNSNTLSKYYIRLFRRLPNFNRTNVYADGEVTEDEIKEHMFDDFYHTVNKLAFANNVFGDEISQIYYGEDIEIKSLTDNLGRGLTELYLTVVKTNNGHKAWYEDSKRDDYTDSNGVEHEMHFSHCFGKITAGFDFPVFVDDYNVHKIHNIDLDSLSGITASNVKSNGLKRLMTEYMDFQESTLSLGGEITVSGDTSLIDEYGEGVFFGDLVEYSPSDVKETVLDKVNFRFNTEQREYVKSREFYDLNIDNIVSDDYSLNDSTRTNFIGNYKIEKEQLNEYKTDSTSIIDAVDNKYLYSQDYPINLNPEGYYYNAHFKIQLKEFSDTISQGRHTNISFTELSDSEVKEVTGDTFNLKTAIDYFLFEGDTLYTFDNDTMESGTCKVVTVSGVSNTYVTIKFPEEVTFREKLDDGTFNYPYSLFKINDLKPSYAIELMDGTGRYLWRKEKTEAEYRQDDELYNRVFTNGKIYLHNQLNLYLRRQDPYSDYGLSYSGKEEMPTAIKEINKYGEYTDIDDIEVSTTSESISSCGTSLADDLLNTADEILKVSKDIQASSTYKKLDSFIEGRLDRIINLN